MKKSILFCALLLAGLAHAQVTQDGSCPPGTATCSPSIKNAGDSAVTTNGATHSTSAQNGVSSTANGNVISPNITGKVQQDAAQNLNGHITTGDDSAKASSEATGNKSDNKNMNVAKGGSVSESGNSKNANVLKGGDQKNAQGQGQGQQQGISEAGNSKVKVNGGDQITSAGNGAGAQAGQGAGAGAGSGNPVTVTGDQVDARSIFIPTVVPMTPPSMVPSASISPMFSKCGPLQRVVSTKVNGTEIGWVWNSSIEQGYTGELGEYLDENGNPQMYDLRPDPRGGRIVRGHEVYMGMTVVSIANGKSIAIGGGGSGGNWGQGGGGSSGSNQQPVMTINLRSCEIGRILPPPPPTAPKTDAPLATPEPQVRQPRADRE